MRTETVTKEIYTFDELSDAAKEKARDWWRECETMEGMDTSCILEDAADIAGMFGLDIRQTRVTLVDGDYRYKPTIYYSGFHSQGDGACFEGSYQYKAGALKAVKAYAPQDTELHGIVQGLQNIQKRNFYQLTASCSHRGHYYHSGCMSVSVDRDSLTYQDMTTDAEEDVQDALRSFADWIYSRLEAEYEYIMSDEHVDESIRINEYEFDVNGGIY